LAASGEALLAARSAYVEMLGSAAAQAYARLELAGSLRVEYRPNVEGGRLRERLEESLGQELARRTPLVGPHRDELALLLDGSSLAAFGSQGQKRGAGLALRLAEYAALSRQTGEAPLLLLDDVLSELDEQRGRRLLDAVAPLEQTFLTTTAAQAGSALHSRLYRIENGYVERVGC
jgi:DNA replication and repair protein RecF